MKRFFLFIVSMCVFFVSYTPILSKRVKKTEQEKKIDELSKKMVRHASAGNLDKVRKYIKRGAQVNFKTKRKHETALHEAAEKGHQRVIEYLLFLGADVNAKSKKGETPLHKAATNGDVEMVGVFLKRGAQINAQDKKGRTPLMKAAHKSKKQVVKMLLDAGADTKIQNKKGQTARNYSRGDISQMLEEYLEKKKKIKS